MTKLPNLEEGYRAGSLATGWRREGPTDHLKMWWKSALRTLKLDSSGAQMKTDTLNRNRQERYEMLRWLYVVFRVLSYCSGGRQSY